MTAALVFSAMSLVGPLWSKAERDECARQCPDRQVFHTDRLIGADQLRGELVVELAVLRRKRRSTANEAGNSQGDASSPKRKKKRQGDPTLGHRYTPGAPSTKLLTILLP
ncbi:hypothetical protein AB0M68_33060 [Streptomyces sp. NPDC051453]|uniref:hypothetical protein n=1 Tax=Streptomyces sp. NPDC051453 TaxID=3154941 RepID=UPI00341E9A49